MAPLREENIRLLQPLSLREADTERHAPIANVEEVARVNEQYRQLLKERVALKTILEGKIQGLLHASLQSLQPTVSQAQPIQDVCWYLRRVAAGICTLGLPVCRRTWAVRCRRLRVS